METIVVEYLVKKLWEDIRSKRAIDPYLAKAINTDDFIVRFHKEVTAEDKEHILRLISSDNVWTSRLGIILTRYSHSIIPVAHDTLIQKWYSPSWESDETEFLIKVALMYRILDKKDINPNAKINKDIYDYILKNFKRWSEKVLGYYQFDGNWENLIQLTENELTDERNPEHKKWIYLLLLSVHPEKEKIKGIIERYTSSEYPMVKMVTSKLLADIQER